MAKNKSKIYLGYEDEPVTEKHKSIVNYTTNKFGGLPDWGASEVTIPNCALCGLVRPLILQLYAPLENSQFHRTLYIFACLNPSCSVLSKSWICIRTQLLEKSPDPDIECSKTKSLTTWCSGAEDWGDDPDINEENGNVVIRNDNRISDDDDESNSTENEVFAGFVNLNVDDKNANNGGAQGGGAVGTAMPMTFAEIEGEEPEVITVETPTVPERDLIALLKQTPAIPANLDNILLKSFFIAVDEEKKNGQNNYNYMNDHIRELLQEYQMKDEICRKSPESPIASIDSESESYEKGIPAHGDVMFHNFLTTIQENPGQLVRYSRDTYPLLIAPLCEPVPKCQYCGSDCICEIQILPTVIPKLRLESGDNVPIEFGNILVFTCLQSCWDTPDKMRLEHVIVQQEH